MTNEQSHPRKPMRKGHGNAGRLWSLVAKNVKLNMRDKGNYFWVFGYPMLFIMIFALAFNTGGGERSTYTVAFINEDTIGATHDLEQNVSLTFLSLFDGNEPGNDLARSFKIAAHVNGSALGKAEAMELVEQGSIDAVIIIPRNFSETVIGSTWWFQLMTSPAFQSLDPAMQEGFQQGLPPSWVEAITNNSLDFPAGESPALEIHAKPDTVTKAVIGGVFDGIMNDIVLAYNNVSRVNTQVHDAGVLFTLTPFDWMAPGIVIVGVTISIMMVAQTFGMEKERGLIKRLDTTPVSRPIQLLSGGVAQVLYSSVQITILLGFLALLGVQTAPNINWLLAFFTGLVMTFPCIGIGLLIAAFVKSGNDAGGLSWMAILPLQFLGNAFFYLGDTGIMQAVPTFYGVRAMQNVMIRGMGLGGVWIDLLVIALFGVAFLVAGLVAYQKKCQA